MVNKFLESESLNFLNSGYDFAKNTFTQSYCYRRAENIISIMGVSGSCLKLWIVPRMFGFHILYYQQLCISFLTDKLEVYGINFYRIYVVYLTGYM